MVAYALRHRVSGLWIVAQNGYLILGPSVDHAYLQLTRPTLDAIDVVTDGFVSAFEVVEVQVTDQRNRFEVFILVVAMLVLGFSLGRLLVIGVGL
jgi:hypothetical protein